MTQTAQHTHGPWTHLRQRASNDRHDVVAPQAGGLPIPVAVCGHQSCDDGIIAANARLIAASPRLLSELAALLSAAEGMYNEIDPDVERTDETADAWCAAIADARATLADL